MLIDMDEDRENNPKNEEDIAEMNRVLSLYETNIERQKDLIVKVTRGKFRCASVTDDVLKALVVGDYKLLQSQRDKLKQDISEMERR